MLSNDVFNFFVVFFCFFGGFWSIFSMVLSTLDPFSGSTHLNNEVFQLLVRNIWNADEPLQVTMLPTPSVHHVISSSRAVDGHHVAITLPIARRSSRCRLKKSRCKRRPGRWRTTWALREASHQSSTGCRSCGS